MKDMIFELLRPFLTFWVMLRYGSIWGLKEALRQGKGGRKLMNLCYGHYFMRRGSFVGLTSRMTQTPCFPHGIQGIFISNDAVLGKDVVIFQQVTIGSNTLADSKNSGSPEIGDGVYIGAGAKIIGGVRIGHHCRIGANAVVYQDMEPYSVAVCAPTRIIQKAGLDNTFYTTIEGVEYVFRDGGLRPKR